MTDFAITEDFLKNEIEFDKHFSKLKPVSNIYSLKNGRTVSSARNVAGRTVLIQ